MCYHKALVAKDKALMEHYAASFESITEEVEYIREKFSILMERDVSQSPYSKEEMGMLRWYERTLRSFADGTFRRFHENGFDFLPTPVITAGAPDQFKLFNWGLVPYFMTDRPAAMDIRKSTLLCVSEEMYGKRAYEQAVKNGQRCLIPVSGLYEWRWLDPKGKNKVPYFISVKDQEFFSIAGIYSRWKDKAADQYYYSFSMLTTAANAKMEYIHNHGKRMPVIIPREYERDWLNGNLSKDDVLALCRPLHDDDMKAHTISGLITKRDVDTNVDEVCAPYRYENKEIVEEL